MTINLTTQEQTAAIREFSEILGFYIAFEEGATVKERAETFAKNYPVFSKIRDQIINPTEEKEVATPKKNGKKISEPLITE